MDEYYDLVSEYISVVLMSVLPVNVIGIGVLNVFFFSSGV